jgi:hypothetical protein
MAAGLGFKTFNTGDVLSAADVNGYLMQGILVFASATARDAAITSPEEGQFAFLKDTNVTTYYTGSAWANVDTTGMTNPMTTTGDVIYSSSGSTPARLGIGTAGQVLQVNSGATAPEWAAPSGGKVVQIVNATNGTQTILSSSSFADSNLSATITPTSASNQILVFVTHSGCGKYSSNTALQVRLLRGATTILNIESAAASDSGSGENMIGSIAANYLDSPATTSATTYKTQICSRANTGSAYINDATSPGSNSTITLMEVTP